MKPLLSLTYFMLIYFFVSCNNSDADKLEKNSSAITIPSHSFSYNYDPSSTKLKWTAFKHVAKVGVEGEFERIEVNGFKPSNKVSDAIKNVSFNIFTSSTNTQDKGRDMKVVADFFGNMLNPTVICGKIKDIEGSENGNGNVLIKMNGIEKLIPFKWKIEKNNQFILKTKLNVLNWDLDEALEILNNVCLKKHTDKNGENKLWPNVEITVFTTLIKK